MPGLIDAHTHMSSERPGQRALNRQMATGADYALVGMENARNMLLAGFTTTRDLGGFDYADLAVKRAIDRGAIAGPRMLVALSLVSATGGHGDPTNGLSPNIRFDNPNGVANGVEGVRLKVRELTKNGADVIKFAATGGGMSRGTKPTAQQFTDEEMQAIVSEAHRLGVKAAAHAHGTEGIKAAVKAGVDSIEHGIYLDEEACRMMIEHGTYFVPTLWIADSYFERYKEWQVPDYAHAKISQFIPTALKSVEMAIKMKVKIAVGTDAGVGEHELAGKEFPALVKHGMAPMDAIVAGTSNAAKLLGLDGEIGYARSRQVGRPDCREGRPAGGDLADGARRLRDEEGRGLQGSAGGATVYGRRDAVSTGGWPAALSCLFTAASLDPSSSSSLASCAPMAVDSSSNAAIA